MHGRLSIEAMLFAMLVLPAPEVPTTTMRICASRPLEPNVQIWPDPDDAACPLLRRFQGLSGRALNAFQSAML